MQILVVGMHRSGTSLVTRIINMMGAYFGLEAEALGSDLFNPKGYWERKDVLELNDQILRARGCTWYSPYQWSNSPGFSAPDPALSVVSRLVSRMDVHLPWVIKDPRLCVTLPRWLEALENPVAVIVSRNPQAVVASLNTRDAIPHESALSLWEFYARSALRNTQGMLRVFVRYEDFMTAPEEATHALYYQLTNIGVRDLRLPIKRETLAFVDSELQRSSSDTLCCLSDEQTQLDSMLQGKYPFNLEPPTVSHQAGDILNNSQSDTDTLSDQDMAAGQALRHPSRCFGASDLQSHSMLSTPTFLCIGAQKAGTTWLYQNLLKHDEIWMPPIKELHYFDKIAPPPYPTAYHNFCRRSTDVSWLRAATEHVLQLTDMGFDEAAAWYSRFYFSDYSDEWYVSLFEWAEGAVTGDLTPAYATLTEEKIQKLIGLLPNLKIIFILRDPVERAWSACKHEYKLRGRLDLEDPDRVLEFIESPEQELRSDYIGTLDRYLKYFDNENILLGFYDAIQDNPVQLINEVLDFLGVSKGSSAFQDDLVVRVHASSEKELSPIVRKRLDHKFSQLKQRVAARLGGYSTAWLDGGIKDKTKGFSATRHP